MPEITLQYRAQVYVVVDTDERTVGRVVVDDENLSEVPEAAYERDGKPMALEDEDAKSARDVAGGDEAWPSWSFGW